MPSILRMRRGIPRACLTLIYQQPTARIAAASEACGSVCCAIYTSREDAAPPRLSLPLPQVYSQLNTVSCIDPLNSQFSYLPPVAALVLTF